MLDEENEEKPSEEKPTEENQPKESQEMKSEEATETPSAAPEAPKNIVPPTPVELLPKQVVEILQMTKTGAITLPKEFRDTLPEKAMFAFWRDMNRFVFQPISEADIPNLNLGEKEKETEKAGEKKARKKKEGQGQKATSKRSEPVGPQPEPNKYFVYDFDGKDKISTILESAFWKFAQMPPNIDEGTERIKYALMTFIGKGPTNDSRLRNTMILFICDVVEKFGFKELLAFAEEKILPNISSKFLCEQSLNSLIITALIIKDTEKSLSYLTKLFDSIEQYPDNQIFDIKDSFKNLIKPILRSKAELNSEIKDLIVQEITKFIDGFEVPPKKEGESPVTHSPVAPDTALEFIDHLEKLHFIEEAYTLADKVLKSLPIDSKEIDLFREKINELNAKPV